MKPNNLSMENSAKQALQPLSSPNLLPQWWPKMHISYQKNSWPTELDEMYFERLIK
jgi:hypothetical protein